MGLPSAFFDSAITFPPHQYFFRLLAGAMQSPYMNIGGIDASMLAVGFRSLLSHRYC
jgi:hypothetical protein